jgi:hypothetical protein
MERDREGAGAKRGECPLSNVVVVEEAPSLFLLTLRAMDLKKGQI